ncbi:atrial natriuretic peptide receptor 1-like [Danaus plexippus]|nr:atrial natriuretic peptide receptor 1-like [Danaus plexippus]XP_061383861.1 atrial natriuretic peptide receptor 1-like [Danaus plexippus]
MKRTESIKRISVYKKLNSILLVHMIKAVKATKTPLWRQLSACYEFIKTLEDLSILQTLVTYSLVSADQEQLLEPVKQQFELAVEHLESALQYLEFEKFNDDEILKEMLMYYKTTLTNVSEADFKMDDWDSVGNDYVEKTSGFVEVSKTMQTGLWKYVRKSADHEVWYARRTLALGVFVLVIVLLASPVLILILRHIITTIQAFTESIQHSTEQLMAEKQKSDLLLSRMLPLPVLKRLRAQRTVPAEAFDAVTIYFSDIVGFTNISANSTPMEIINMLNMLYRLFDDRIMQYNVYKVETIGDAYMVVSGLPQRNGNRHVSEIADMALSLLRCVEGAVVPHRPEEPLRVRAGVNTGPCVAGVVGATMPRYCLFGDAINTASRMESTGEAMKIHISSSTKEALDKIGNYITESRGMIDVAGKGLMETFWLVGKVGNMVSESPCQLKLEDYDQNTLELLIK